MSAIFISHSSTDNAWAREIRDWLKGGDRKTEPERRYASLFLDFDPEVGIPPGQSWRQALYSKLELSRAVIVICSPAYCASQWCLAELAIAIDRGKLVLPVRIAPREDHSDLPRLRVETQATRLEPIGLGPGAGSGWEQLERGLEPLSWRDRLVWKEGECPFPGLDAFEERQAPVFFGRDAAIAELRERVTSLAGRLPALLLLLGASGYGKSSLVRAGLLPRLKADAQRDWLVLEPFRPGRTPFARLEGVVARARASIGRSALAEPTPEPLRTPEALLTRLDALRPAAQRRDAPFVIVIDQLEELLADTRPASPRAEPSEGERFLALLRDLLNTPLAGVLVIATLRTDALAPLQALRPELVARAHTVTLQPIRREDYGELISGPAARSGLAAQPGLAERLVSDRGSGDALPLLAFTLEKLWRRRQERGTAAAGPGGQLWDLTSADYEALGGGVAGVVSQQAREVWEESTSPAEETAALREAFLGHLVRLSAEGLATKRAARWGALPELSKPILERFVAARLLVTGKGEARDQVEIAHEAMLRTWPTLVGWLEEGREELLQRRRVERLCAELTPERPEPVRRLALDELARLAAAGAGDRRAVELAAASPLEALLRGEGFVIAEREDAALLLALIGAERPLR
ncbi:MAG: toll/interleukin-1 receptor domain-containing protein, partial [Cyanobacteriota bacterium]